MKITTFNPQIYSKDADPVVELFEKLGFEKRHDQEGIGELNVEAIRMMNNDGFYLDISCSDIELPRDLVGIRMNVDDFDSAYQMLLERGFRNIYGKKTVETETGKSATLISQSGFGINLVQHKK